MKNRKSIKIGSQTLKELNTLKHRLEAITENKLSIDKVIRILICVRSIEEQLIE